MLASSGETTPPCGVPFSDLDQIPWSTTPAFSHFPISRFIPPSLTRLPRNSRSSLWSILSKEHTTHYPSRRLPGKGNNYSGSSSITRKTSRCSWLAPSRRYIAFNISAAWWKQIFYSRHLDKPSRNLSWKVTFSSQEIPSRSYRYSYNIFKCLQDSRCSSW